MKLTLKSPKRLYSDKNYYRYTIAIARYLSLYNVILHFTFLINISFPLNFIDSKISKVIIVIETPCICVYVHRVCRNSTDYIQMDILPHRAD